MTAACAFASVSAAAAADAVAADAADAAVAANALSAAMPLRRGASAGVLAGVADEAMGVQRAGALHFSTLLCTAHGASRAGSGKRARR